LINVDQSAETGHSKYESLNDATMMTRKRVALEHEQAFPSAVSINKNDSKSGYAKKG
jgi:hypothetical protein